MVTKGFFEMEMVTLEEINEFEEELRDCCVDFVSDKTMASDNLALIYSAYADFKNTSYAEDGLIEEESAHDYNHLKVEYEEKFG